MDFSVNVSKCNFLEPFKTLPSSAMKKLVRNDGYKNPMSIKPIVIPMIVTYFPPLTQPFAIKYCKKTGKTNLQNEPEKLVEEF